MPASLALIPAAPEFRPTAEEWADPYKFIESIRTIGEQAGVIKVIPPAGWKPPFAVDVEVNKQAGLLFASYSNPGDQ